MKIKVAFWVNSVISILGIITMIVLLVNGYREYSYIPLLIGIFTYGNTKVIQVIIVMGEGQKNENRTK